MPGVVLQVEEALNPALVGNPDLALGVRGTARHETAGDFTMRTYLWHWGLGSGHELRRPTVPAAYFPASSSYEVDTGAAVARLNNWANVSPYANQLDGNKVRARLAVFKTGPSQAVQWQAGVEALRILSRP